ncbi:MAG TPA: DISARM system SNF2-like helicase DrmD, partial [Nannocystaceae bacterium]|nr:DISARM system SNF2-like helicase DrmD [Nannocystaceae bacterium]
PAPEPATPLLPTDIPPQPPTTASVLAVLQRERLFDLSRTFGAGLRASKQPRLQIAALLAAILGDARLLDILHELARDELRAVCRAHGLPDASPARSELIRALALAAGLDPTQKAAPALPSHDGVPQPGQVLTARGRQWLVESVDLRDHPESPLLRLACLDDDAPGRALELLWDLEIGARVIRPETHGLGRAERLDPPANFGAYLHALKWSAVSAADPNRFQAPFRAGIKLMAYQLTPLMKALELPRANLFIADDVGLGKTIEAGLVLQELILRQQAGFVLIVCPASVSLQWQGEMMRRFGLRFEVMSRHFIGTRRRERGFGINPWATHNRFIISHPLIRRPEYRDPLLAHLGDRAEKGLLILDEAHVAAPAAATKYAVDSDTTAAIRDLAPKFDNRLFLSATPHNGHSNSFSALLEILDPVRFTRGVPVAGAAALAPIMVRRLKRDLRLLGVERFPKRILVGIALGHRAPEGWSALATRYDAEEGTREPPAELARALGGDPSELELAAQLARYTALCAPASGRGRLVFINLQKRLLSSPEAFARTLEVHAAAVQRQGGVTVKLPATSNQADLFEDPEAYGQDDEAIAVEEDAEVRAASQDLPSLTAEATALLKSMRALAERARRQPDAKVRALLAWMRAHLCPGIGRGDDLPATDRAWSTRRLILFTEYGDTKRYLQDLLAAAIDGTDRADERILVLHGGMSDEARDEVQRAFNGDPEHHPVRILIATDAAREGVNLQAHCADLFHIDIPWNPARLEQRNGRIDRTLQPAAEVRCHYFTYEGRAEDRVLDALVRKIATVQRELGSVGAVLLDEMERALEPGITASTQSTLESIGADAHARTADEELEVTRKNLDKLRAEVHTAGQRLEESRRALEVGPEALRGVVDIGLRFAGAAPLTQGPPTESGRPTFLLPDLDRSWQPVVDLLRPPRGRDEPFWEWRKRPPKPVTFEPLDRLGDDAEQLHLAHPFVKRILDRFLAQGYGAHDLSRVTGVVHPGEHGARVLAYARLTLFGPGAARLHDELITVAAPWPRTGQDLAPYRDPVTAAKARELCERAL